MTRPLTETEKRFADEQAALQKDIDALQQKLRESQAKLRAAAKEQLRVHQETLGSWVTAAGLGDVAPEVLKPGLLALAAVVQNPKAFTQFCAEWLTAEEVASEESARVPKPVVEAA